MAFSSLNEAVARAFGADSVATAPGGTDLVSDECQKIALLRAVELGVGAADAHRLLQAADEKIKKSVMQCDSPIERRLLPALIFANYGPKFLSFPAVLHCPKIDELPPRGDIIVVPQFAMVKYRFDFGIVASSASQTKIFAVECDGAGYHTVKKDYIRDMERDLYIEAFGIKTLRFSGKDIVADAISVGRIVARTISAWRDELP